MQTEKKKFALARRGKKVTNAERRKIKAGMKKRKIRLKSERMRKERTRKERMKKERMCEQMREWKKK